MRTGVGAEFPHHDRFYGVEAPPRAVVPYTPSPSAPSTHLRANHPRANIGRLFAELRNALRVTPDQLSAHLFAAPETIVALETGQFEYLPPWPETVRIVMAYTALAGIDGRPVLKAIADALSGPDVPHRNGMAFRDTANGDMVIGDMFVEDIATGNTARGSTMPVLIEHNAAPHSVAAQSQHHRAQGFPAFPVEIWKRAGTALASGAKRLPAGALKHMRQRPERAFYAVSLPLGILLLLLNTSALEAAFSHVPRPVARLAQDVRHFFQEQFAPVHEGLRWIDVDDPRRRRGDKLR